MTEHATGDIRALVDRAAYPNIILLTDAIIGRWPEHQRYITTSYAGRDGGLMHYAEKLAAMIVKLSTEVEGGLVTLADDYRFLCEKIIQPEEIYFRRNNHQYRLKTFAEAYAEVYSNEPYMTRYMNGLLVTQSIWSNHCRAMQHYMGQFLAGLPAGAQLLEVGPGHGLLLALASESPQVAEIHAWDVSDASLELSRRGLALLSVTKPVTLTKRNIFDDPPAASGDEQFDGVVLSEVLEHMEHPRAGVQALFNLCRPGGTVWIHIPANSPSPDHLYLLSNPQELVELVTSVGFEVVHADSFPMSGTTLEKAIRQKLSISCVIRARRPLP